MHVGLIGNSKMSLCASASEKINSCLHCLCLCGPVMDFGLSRMYPAFYRGVLELGTSSLRPRKKKKSKFTNWIDDMMVIVLKL